MIQSEQVRFYLKTHPEGMTQMQALDEFRCFRLAARINDLRNQGEHIQTIMENRNNKRYARYILINKDGEK